MTNKDKRIKELERAIVNHVKQFEKIMRGPASFERGLQLAEIVTQLERVKDKEKSNG